MPDQEGRPLVFSARTLDEEKLQKLEENGIALEQDDFIEVKYIFDESSFLHRLNNPMTQARVFTSKNALFSMQRLAGSRGINLELKKNFVVGIRATEMLKDFGAKVDASAGNAISLAQIIARNRDVKSVDYFCGNKALDDLPEYLESKGITVNKEIVYHTDLKHKEVFTGSLDGAIFLSPTAVFSFFKKNSLPPNIPIFVIGATTGEAVRSRCRNKRVLADEPSLESVIDKVIEYFKANPL